MCETKLPVGMSAIFLVCYNSTKKFNGPFVNLLTCVCSAVDETVLTFQNKFVNINDAVLG